MCPKNVKCQNRAALGHPSSELQSSLIKWHSSLDIFHYRNAIILWLIEAKIIGVGRLTLGIPIWDWGLIEYLLLFEQENEYT